MEKVETCKTFFSFAIEIQYYKLERTKKRIRENNEHLVPRPFTSNNNDHISHVISVSFLFEINRELEGFKRIGKNGTKKIAGTTRTSHHPAVVSFAFKSTY